MKEQNVADILRVEGIMAQGYGLNPKIVMRDKRLTPEAKCIYSYISSFAGSGSQAFPSRDVMLDELQMSKNRYYKHFALLIDYDYIRVERVKIPGENLYGKNVYTLVAVPNPLEADAGESSKEEICKNDTQKEKERPVKRRGVGQQEQSRTAELRERLQIEQMKSQDSGNASTIDEIFLAIKDMDHSEQIKIGGAVKKKEAIQELLDSLTAEHIRFVVHNIQNYKKSILNRKSYLQSCIANSVFDLNAQKRETIAVEGQMRKQELQRRQQEQTQKLLCKKYPELQSIDFRLTEILKAMSKAILRGDELTHSRLSGEKEKLEQERAVFLQKCGETQYI